MEGIGACCFADDSFILLAPRLVLKDYSVTVQIFVCATSFVPVGIEWLHLSEACGDYSQATLCLFG